MQRITRFALIATLLGAGAAHAQSGTAAGQAQAGSGSAEVSGQTQAAAEATAPSPDELRQQIETRGAKVSSKARARAESRLEAAAQKVDAQASHGENVVAGRLATEFGMTAEAIEAEKSSLNVSWGQLMIAHTLMANASTSVTAQQLFDMRAGGMGWGQIAAGLGLKLGDVVSAVKTEESVAAGRARADGRVAVIHGEGARAGLGGGVGVNAGAGPKGLGIGAGTGIKVGH